MDGLGHVWVAVVEVRLLVQRRIRWQRSGDGLDAPREALPRRERAQDPAGAGARVVEYLVGVDALYLTGRRDDDGQVLLPAGLTVPLNPGDPAAVQYPRHALHPVRCCPHGA